MNNHPTTDKQLKTKINKMIVEWLDGTKIPGATVVTNDIAEQIASLVSAHTAAARIDELNWLPNDITGVREYVANRRLELQATNPEEK